MTEALRQRNPAVDIAKGIAMLLVIYGHALGLFFEPASRDVQAAALPQLRFIYSFHMPLFFLLSGMVFRARSLRESVRRSLSLLLTAYLVHVVCWIAEPLLTGQPPTVAGLLLPMLRLRGFHSVIVWFLASLALVQLAYFVLASYGDRVRWPLLLALLGGFAWSQRAGSTLLQLQSVLPGLAFFALGHALARTDIGAWVRGRRWPLALAGLCVAWWMSGQNGGCALQPAGRCDNIPGGFVALMIAGQYGFLPWFGQAAVIGSLAVVCSAWVVAEHLPGLASALSWIGRRSLQLLVVNGLVIFFLHPLVEGRLGQPDMATAVGLSLALTGVQLMAAYGMGGITSAPLRLAKYLADKMVVTKA